MTNPKINIIDVGSVGGFDSPWNNHVKCIDWSLSFEPNEPPVLNGKNLKYDCAVWNFDGEAPFYVSGPKGTGSSLLKQNFDSINFIISQHAFSSIFIIFFNYLHFFLILVKFFNFFIPIFFKFCL